MQIQKQGGSNVWNFNWHVYFQEKMHLWFIPMPKLLQKTQIHFPENVYNWSHSLPIHTFETFSPLLFFLIEISWDLCTVHQNLILCTLSKSLSSFQKSFCHLKMATSKKKILSTEVYFTLKCISISNSKSVYVCLKKVSQFFFVRMVSLLCLDCL